MFRVSATANHLRESAMAFAEWCDKAGRLASNPLKVIPRLDQQRDRRRTRRALTDEELGRLLVVAGDRGRKTWYMAAALAGLRKGDLQHLRWWDLDFDQNTITIQEGKAKRSDVIPMHRQLAEELMCLRDEVMATPTAKVFPQTVTDATRRKDFLRAGLAREEVVKNRAGEPIMIGKGRWRRPKTRIVTDDEEGRIIDLHALRTTLGTNLARAGVQPQHAQRIMRHADYRTTIKHYTVLGLTDTRAALARLPGVSTPGTAAATGTDGRRTVEDPQQQPQQLERETARSEAKSCGEPDEEPPDAPGLNFRSYTDLGKDMRREATQCEKRPLGESNPCFQDENLASLATRRRGRRYIVVARRSRPASYTGY